MAIFEDTAEDITDPPTPTFHYLTRATQKSAAVSAIAELLLMDVLLVVMPLTVPSSCDCSGDTTFSNSTL